MSKNLVVFCECIGTHDSSCDLYKRLKIKYKLIEEFNIEGSYVPEWLEIMVDNKMIANQRDNKEEDK